MSGNIRLPNITGKTVEEQAQQMKSYLSQLAGELNWALGNMPSSGVGGSGGAGYTPYRTANQGGSAVNPQQKTEEILQNFNDIKGLIIKSADIVNAYYEEINTRLEGLYVAQSEYGTFVEQTNATITQNSTGITQNYSNLQLVTGRVDQAETDIVTTREDLTGLIEQTEQSLQGAIAQTEEDLQKSIADTDAALKQTINNTDASLRQVISQTEQSLQGTVSQTDSDLRGVIEAKDKELRGVISQVDADLQQVVSDTEARLAGTVNETEAALQQTINQAKQDMLTDIDSAEQRMSQSISSVEQNLTTDISDTRKALEGSIATTETTLQGNIDNTKTVLGQNIANTESSLAANINTAKSDLKDDIDNAKKDLNGSIAAAQETLGGKISDAKEELEGSIEDAESRLQGKIDSVKEILVEVQAYIKSGLLDYDDSTGIPIYGVEVGQTNEVNGEEVFNKYARFTSDRLSFFDQNGQEVAYISDRKLFIKHAEITDSLAIGGFVDTVMANKSIVTKWVGGVS
jgi:F0F1-type ATP synthase membrane subunit b/b'